MNILKKIYRQLESVINPNVACWSRSVLLRCIGRSIRFRYHDGWFTAKDAHWSRSFKHLRRGFDLYSRGIPQRGTELAESYFLQQIDLHRDDVVIDCGANYGDLTIWLSKHIDMEGYIAYEPCPEAFETLTKNVAAKNLINKGLSDRVGEMTFYLSAEFADSSLLQPARFSKKIEVPVVTLDSEFVRLGLASVKILKLEAEGFEPEILMGGINMLTHCEYVAVDGGPERGIHSETTLEAVANILIPRGFCLLKIGLPSGRALFRNVSLRI